MPHSTLVRLQQPLPSLHYCLLPFRRDTMTTASKAHYASFRANMHTRVAKSDNLKIFTESTYMYRFRLDFFLSIFSPRSFLLSGCEALSNHFFSSPTLPPRQTQSHNHTHAHTLRRKSTTAELRHGKVDWRSTAKSSLCFCRDFSL